MIIEPNNISYRDSAARVVKKESGYYRYIFQEYKAEYDHLMQSGLYEMLTKKDLLIEHQEIEIDTGDPKVYKLLYPTQMHIPRKLSHYSAETEPPAVRVF